MAVGVALVVVAAPPAAAHTVTGVSPTNYKSELLAVTPPVPGVSLRLLDLGNRIELVNHNRFTVVVLGYSGEPYLRVGPTGVFENTHSPAVYLNKAAAGSSTSLPRQADASAPPSWHRTSTSPSVKWRDRRTRWGDPAPPAVKGDPGRAHVVSEWIIGLRQGSATAQVSGRITYVPGPSAIPWLALAVALFLLTAAASFLRRWGPVLSGALALVIAVDVVHSFGIAAATHDPVLLQVGRVLAGGIVATMGWVVGAAVIGAVQDQREGGVVGAGVAAFLLAVFSGMGDLSTLTRSQVPYTFSASAARAAVAITIGVGFGLVAASVAITRHARATTSTETAET